MSKKSGARGNTTSDAGYIQPTVEDTLSEEPDFPIEDPQSGPTATDDTPSQANSGDVSVFQKLLLL